MRPYLREKVAWPQVGNRPGQLVGRLPEADQVRLLGQGGCADDFVRGEGVFDQTVREEGRPTLYGDPGLKDRDKYVEFIRDGCKRGVFRFGRKHVESVSVFFVTKKDGTLRLIIDCRRSNQRFHRPPSVNLFSAAGFGEIRCEPGRELFYGEVDVKNAFYQHGLPRWLSEFFCLPFVTGSELQSMGVDTLDGCRLEPGERVYAQLAVAPMGWNWALYLVQAAHTHILARAVAANRRAVEFQPAPRPEDGACTP